MTDGMDAELLERLVRMETKLDHSLSHIASHEIRLTKLEDRIPDPDHEARLRRVEKWMWLATGLAAAAGGIAGGVLQSIMGL